MLGTYKKHPQAYLLYVEDCFLLSDNADARIFAKGLRKIFLKKSISEAARMPLVLSSSDVLPQGKTRVLR